ncbi:MAG: 50S ribosomal protein L10 [Acidimicrobiia bacterium]|nr:50S ribosomal protein L10 [Acidimicrobiia bacterium]
MPRPEKVQAVADIKERISNAQAVFLAEYAGLSVSQQQTLRRELKANGAEFKVVKMTLARLAASELDIDTLDEHLLGPTGLAIADGDAVAAAKVLKDFGKDNDVFKVKAGLLGLEYLSPERVSELADIEPREVLLAKLAGLFAAPMGNTAGLLAAVQRDVVGLVQALVGKREDEGEVAPAAAAEEEPTADDAAEEAPADEASAPSDEGDDEAAEPADEASEEDAAPEASDETPEDDSSDDDTSETTEPEASADEASEEDASADDGEEGEEDEAASSEDEESPAEADGDEEAEEE